MMTPSDYLLDGIIRDLIGLESYDDREIESATVLMKTLEIVSLTVTTASSVDAVSETFTVDFVDESLGLRFLKAAGLKGVKVAGVRLWLERGESVALQLKQRPTLQVTKCILNQLLEAEKE